MACGPSPPNPPRPRPIPVLRWLHSLLHVSLGVVVVVWTAVSLFADQSWFLDRFIHFRMQIEALLGLLVLALACFCLLRRQFGWSDGVVLALSLAMLVWNGADAFSLTPAYQALRPPANHNATVGRIKLLVANVEKPNRQFERVVDLIQREEPDLVLLIEVDEAWTMAVQEVTAPFPYRQVQAQEGAFGIGLWSKLPIVHSELQEPVGPFPVLKADLRLDQAGFRFIGLHPPPPASQPLSHYRDEMLRWLAQVVAASDSPALVAGDLNITTYSPHLRRLCRDGRLFDASAGSGIWHTWPAHGPSSLLFGIRIDHVLISRHWSVSAVTCGPYIGSDHYPLLAELTLHE